MLEGEEWNLGKADGSFRYHSVEARFLKTSEAYMTEIKIW